MAGMAAVRVVQAATEGDDPVVGNPREDRLRKNQAAPGIALVLAKIGPVGNIDLGQRPRCIEAEAPGRIGDTQALRLRDGIEQGLELGIGLCRRQGREARVIACHQAQDHIDLGKGLGNLAVQHVSLAVQAGLGLRQGTFTRLAKNDRQQAGQKQQTGRRGNDKNKAPRGEPLLFAHSSPAGTMAW